MTNTRPYLIAAAAGLLVGGWYLFRPELLFVDRHVNEAPHVVAAAMALPSMTGTFTTDAHETVGRAVIHRGSDGRGVLRLEGFSTSNGPDVRVYLVAADTIAGAATVKRAAVIDLGALKGNIGDQNYELPVDVDLTKYRAVSIWCRRFAVNFGAAALR